MVFRQGSRRFSMKCWQIWVSPLVAPTLNSRTQRKLNSERQTVMTMEKLASQMERYTNCSNNWFKNQSLKKLSFEINIIWPWWQWKNQLRKWYTNWWPFWKPIFKKIELWNKYYKKLELPEMPGSIIYKKKVFCNWPIFVSKIGYFLSLNGRKDCQNTAQSCPWGWRRLT